MLTLFQAIVGPVLQFAQFLLGWYLQYRQGRKAQQLDDILDANERLQENAKIDAKHVSSRDAYDSLRKHNDK